MHTDEALNQLRGTADKLGYTFNLGSLGADKVEVKYGYKDITLFAWYQRTGKDENFGFDLLQGGSKAYSTIEEFTSLVNIYMFINADIIPIAKSIADVFEKELSVNSVYKTFKGNQEQGYVILFNVLNDSSSEIRIRLVGDTEYSATYIKYTDESNETFSIESEKHYFVDDVGNITVKLDIQDYIKDLYERYSESEDINIRRYSQDSFEFDIHTKLHLNVSIYVNDENHYIYKVHSAVDKSGKELVQDGDVEISLTDSFDLEELYDKFVKQENIHGITDLIDERKENISSPAEVFEDFEESISESDEEIFDEVVDEIVDEVVDEIVYETVTKSEKTVEVKEKVNLDNKDVDSMEIKLITEDGKIIDVRFSYPDKILDMNVDVAKEVGIPIHRIATREERILKRGMLITEEEIQKHIFAVDISHNIDLCKKLIFDFLGQ